MKLDCTDENQQKQQLVAAFVKFIRHHKISKGAVTLLMRWPDEWKAQAIYDGEWWEFELDELYSLGLRLSSYKGILEGGVSVKKESI